MYDLWTWRVSRFSDLYGARTRFASPNAPDGSHYSTAPHSMTSEGEQASNRNSDYIKLAFSCPRTIVVLRIGIL